MPIVIAALLVVCGVVGIVHPAQAYIDPGTGSVIVQGLIGAVAGGLVIIRIYWAKISTFMGLSKRSEKTHGEDSD
jgi:hypothetical protein